MTQIGANYGQALYQLAREESLEETILRQLQTLEQAFSQEPQFLELLGSHSLTKQERCDINIVIDKCSRPILSLFDFVGDGSRAPLH